MSFSWIRKYRPESTKDIVGQDLQIRNLKQFINKFSKQKKKAAFVYGPSGCGKTISVYAVANETDLEVIEVNASDFRNKAQINLVVGGALGQQSLFAKGKVILIDEVDGLSGMKDRGGIAAVTKLIKDSNYPIILTAHHPWESKFSGLRSKCNLIEFNELDYKDVYGALKRICKKEKIKFDDHALKSLARRSGGDLRAAVNDLQSLAEEGKELSNNDLDKLSDRQKVDTMNDALLKVFKTKDPFIAINAFDSVDEDFDQRFLWLEENIPYEYKKPEDIYRAFDALSKADVYRGRIRRWQHWRFLVYINALQSMGVALAKDERYKDSVKYKQTGRLLKIFWANRKAMKKKAIAAKFAEHTHCSMKRALRDIDYLKPMFKDKEIAVKITEELDLDKEEVAWLRK